MLLILAPEIFPLDEPYLIRMVFRAVFDGSRSHGDGLKMLNGVKWHIEFINRQLHYIVWCKQVLSQGSLIIFQTLCLSPLLFHYFSFFPQFLFFVLRASFFFSCQSLTCAARIYTELELNTYQSSYIKLLIPAQSKPANTTRGTQGSLSISVPQRSLAILGLPQLKDKWVLQHFSKSTSEILF